jgi:hypothetical protein
MSIFHNKRIDEHTTMVPLGRDQFKYREGDHEMHVTAELTAGTPARVVYASSVKRWLPPHDGETISEDKKAAILKKVVQYFMNNEITYRIVN